LEIKELIQVCWNIEDEKTRKRERANRQTVFAAEDDYRYYLENLAEWKEVYECMIHAL